MPCPQGLIATQSGVATAVTGRSDPPCNCLLTGCGDESIFKNVVVQGI